VTGPTPGPSSTTLRPGGELVGPPSRLRLAGVDELPDELADVVRQTGERSILAFGLNGVTAARFFAWMTAVMSADAGALPPVERELVAVVVAAENRCGISLTYHLRALGERCDDPERAVRIAVSPSTAGLSDRELAITELALMITRRPGEVAAALEPLRACGMSDEEIYGVVEVAAAYNAATRLENVLGLTPTPGAGEMDLSLGH
jgi:uncharacterized peroxidase-related enzyme